MKGQPKMDETQIIPKSQLVSKKLPNIEQDLEMESQIRMPSIDKKHSKSNSAQVEFGYKLKRIINLNSNKKNSSRAVQSHSLFLNNKRIKEKDRFASGILKNQNLPLITPISEHKRNKSALDKILADRDDFAKGYFQQLNRAQRNRKNRSQNQEMEQGVEFQFPEIKVNSWKVKGYLKQSHILLKGTHKDGQICIKKYEYKKIYEKIRRDYQTWVQSKFCFES